MSSGHFGIRQDRENVDHRCSIGRASRQVKSVRYFTDALRKHAFSKPRKTIADPKTLLAPNSASPSFIAWGVQIEVSAFDQPTFEICEHCSIRCQHGTEFTYDAGQTRSWRSARRRNLALIYCHYVQEQRSYPYVIELPFTRDSHALWLLRRARLHFERARRMLKILMRR